MATEEVHNLEWMGDPTFRRRPCLPTLQIAVDYFKEKGIPLDKVQFQTDSTREMFCVVTLEVETDE